MRAFVSFTLVLAGSLLAEGRVTFPYSEVLQQQDLAQYGKNAYRASFKCAYGCKVYAEPADSDMKIAQNGNDIATFWDFYKWNADDSLTLVGWELPAGENYTIKTESPIYAQSVFIFYTVSSQAPNYGAKVMAADPLISASDEGRYVTVINNFNAILFHDFSGNFPSGYPKLYATGYDAVSDVYGVTKCTPVYQARSQYSAEQSSLSIYAPIVTVDFGYAGKHSVLVNGTRGQTPAKSAVSSTVYMSPGFVGCPFIGNVTYNRIRDEIASVSDSFTLMADSLDIFADYNAIAASEAVRFTVNQDDLDFFNNNTASFSKHYGEGAFKVDLSWTRKTANSSWSLQLDFGLGEYQQTKTASASTSAELVSSSRSPVWTTTVEEQSTTPFSTTIVAGERTTSGHGGNALSLVISTVIILVFV